MPVEAVLTHIVASLVDIHLLIEFLICIPMGLPCKLILLNLCGETHFLRQVGGVANLYLQPLTTRPALCQSWLKVRMSYTNQSHTSECSLLLSVSLCTFQCNHQAYI